MLFTADRSIRLFAGSYPFVLSSRVDGLRLRIPPRTLTRDLSDLRRRLPLVLREELIGHKVRDIFRAVVREPVANPTPAVDIPTKIIFRHLLTSSIGDTIAVHPELI